ncbi:hypothetical protein BH10ACT1_BH10ACT1_05480 [soil metagenome]
MRRVWGPDRAGPSRLSRRRGVAGFTLLAVSLALLGVGWSEPGSAEPAQAATTPVPVVLKGEGSWGPYRELVTWQDDLYGAKAPVDLEYTSTGSPLGRQDFLAGGLDYVVSGRPFSTDELAQVKGGAAGLIDVPIQVEAMAFLLAVPLPEGFESITLVCDPYDPDTPDPDACIVRAAYEGPIRIPNANLAAMLFRYAGSGSLPASSWNDPAVLAAMGVPNFSLPEQASPAPVMRSEPSATNYYLQEFAKTAAPSVWAGLKAANPDVPWEPITERLARQGGSSRQGVDQQSLQLGLTGADPATGTVGQFTKGILAPVPASALGAVHDAFPNTELTFVEVQNASGEWVAPTPESIDKAVDLGGDDPLHALTNAAPGAYPMVWVNHLYAPATGLSIDKTEALATTIRYLATSGQEAAEPVGDGRLSAALVEKALAGADSLVTSNCVGSDRQIVKSTDPGPHAPDLPGLKSIGSMLHCVAAPGATTTTQATTTVPGTLPLTAEPYYDPTATFEDDFDSTLFSEDSGIAAPVETTAAPAPTTKPAKVAATTTTLDMEPVVATLALPQPMGVHSGYDRLAALLMGAALYLLFGPVSRRLFVRVRG